MTISINLTRGFTSIVDDCDKDLAEVKWCAVTNLGGKTYATREVAGTSVIMHRVILERMVGRPLISAELTDHKNTFATLDNRRANLRICDAIMNSGNRKMSKNNRSGYKGITFGDQRWRATITINKVPTQLGKFEDPISAHEAYCIAALKHFKEFAYFGETSPFLGWTLIDFERGYKQLQLPFLEAA